MDRTRPIAVFGIVILAAAVFGASAAYMQGAREERFTTARLGDMSLRIELATSTDQRAQGLSGLADVPDRYGMLFAFKEPGNYGFWMKNMQVPIDILWLEDDTEGKGQSLKVIGITQMVSPESYPDVFYPPFPVRYVLETRAGFARDLGVATGTELRLKNPPIVSE